MKMIVIIANNNSHSQPLRKLKKTNKNTTKPQQRAEVQNKRLREKLKVTLNMALWLAPNGLLVWVLLDTKQNIMILQKNTMPVGNGQKCHWKWCWEPVDNRHCALKQEIALLPTLSCTLYHQEGRSPPTNQEETSWNLKLTQINWNTCWTMLIYLRKCSTGNIIPLLIIITICQLALGETQ